ncbi:MAG: hypothetical protein KBA95_18095 [Acidobacteria bacterium]|nr:hypothetical protein [Acidobacteriota bacterium]
MRTLDAKLQAIHADPAGAPDFILADARDADMAFGLASPGVDPATGRMRSLAEYRDQIREIVRQGLVDVMLMSASTNDVLAREGLFAGSAVTPAVRANDATDIHVLAGAPYPKQPSRPFRTPRIDELMLGGADLALYSITPAGDAERDATALEAYREFRAEAEAAGLRHFLELFAPNVPVPMPDIGRFLNDFVARTLAGIPARGRPIFLKMPYSGPQAMEELVAYDPHLVPGVLGGSAGTTHDAFRLLEEARRHGARVALFGRKIKNAEHQLSFVKWLRAIADGEIGAAEACRAYHGDLERLGIRPHRSLEADLQLTEAVLGVGSN